MNLTEKDLSLLKTLVRRRIKQEENRLKKKLEQDSLNFHPAFLQSNIDTLLNLEEKLEVMSLEN